MLVPATWVTPGVRAHMVHLAHATQGRLHLSVFEDAPIRTLMQQMAEPQQHRFLELLRREAAARPVADPHLFVSAWAQDFRQASYRL